MVKKFLILLIVFSAFLRFYNLSNLYIFGFDEEYQATYAMTLVRDFHPIWIGVSASFLDYYLGPYFTYFSAFWLMLSRGDPLITAYVAAVAGVATSVAVFLAGWKFFNLTAGVISSLLYAGLPLFVFFDQKYWNPMFVQLIVLTMFVSLILIRKSPRWWLLFTAAIGAIFETDLAPLPLALIGLWLFIKGKYFLNRKLVLGCIVVFLFFYWPLLVFDYNHNFSNLRVFSRYGQQAKQAGVKFDPVNKFASFLDTMGRFWYLNPGHSNADELNISCDTGKTQPSPWLSGLSVILFLYFLKMAFEKKEYTYSLLAYFLIVSLGFYLIYTGGSFEYYLRGFVTLFVLAVGVIISSAKKIKPLVFILLVIILATGFKTVVNSSDKFSLGPKKKLIGEVMEKVASNSFSIEGAGVCHNWEGWRYLFKVYGRAPVKSYTDQNFGWLYPEELNNKQAVYSVTLSEYGTIKAGGFGADIIKIK